MELLSSQITSKGQITIPAVLREALQLLPGQRVQFREQDGHLVVEPVLNDVTAAFGMFKAEPNPVATDNLSPAEAAAAARYLATRKT